VFDRYKNHILQEKYLFLQETLKNLVEKKLNLWLKNGVPVPADL
jgi:hypothetical protein